MSSWEDCVDDDDNNILKLFCYEHIIPHEQHHTSTTAAAITDWETLTTSTTPHARSKVKE